MSASMSEVVGGVTVYLEKIIALRKKHLISNSQVVMMMVTSKSAHKLVSCRAQTWIGNQRLNII